VHHDGGESIALDLTVTPELRRLGMARDVVRQIQEARKASGFDVSDRVVVTWSAPPEVREAILEHAEVVAAEVLATSLLESDAGALDGPDPVFDDAATGLRFVLERS
jgi:isoleucyl-tRNA synthetase